MQEVSRRCVLAVFGSGFVLPGSVQALAQQVVPRANQRHIIVPQRRPVSAESMTAIQIERVDVSAVIREQVAHTTMDIALKNRSSRRLEAELILPVPDKSVVGAFTFQGAAQEPKLEVLPKAKAKQIYNSIVSKLRDPALLEFIRYNLLRTSVFPVEAQSNQKIRLSYEHVLPRDGERMDYVIPRSEAVDYEVPWNIAIQIHSRDNIATVYSPSHAIESQPGRTPQSTTVRVAKSARQQPGAFQLSYLVEKGELSASLFSYPDPKLKGGYFLMLAGLPSKPTKKKGIRREVTLVIDRSGSMNGEKLEQVREAALQIISGLERDEYFNVITYNESVDLFSERPLLRTKKHLKAARKYLEGVRAQGGTNIHDALLEGLRQPPQKNTLPMVLFLTDGIPTIGQTSEQAIRDIVTKANPHNRRVFTFGVGLDVNSPLLENVAYRSRGTTTFVLPGEDVEVKVAGVFKRLSGPILATPVLEAVTGESNNSAPGRVRDVLPDQLPDLFEGDQLIVLGQYIGDEPLHLRLRGNYLGSTKSFAYTFDLKKATTRNGFVPRLWASRKVGVLIDAIRSSGADASATTGETLDPKLQELVEEIVNISTEFGILTEYTAFLAREGTDLSKPADVLTRANMLFQVRAQQTRTGLGSISQDLNSINQKAAVCVNPKNSYWNAQLNSVSVSNVQQVCNQAFYCRSGKWIDSKLVNEAPAAKPDRIVEFASPEYFEIAERLADEHRAVTLALGRDVVLLIDGKSTLIKAPAKS